MRGRPTPLLLVLALLSGCLAAPPAELEGAAVDAAPAPGPGLLVAPRVLHVPAGSSYAVVQLDATPADWVEHDGRTWLFLGYEFPEDVELEAAGVQFYEVEGTTLRTAGSSAGPGGGAGGSGRAGEPRAAPFFVGVQVLNASAPFELRLGAQEALMDFELEGETLPAKVLASGREARFAVYLELGSPFDLSFGGGAFAAGVDVEDSRVVLPGSEAVALARALRLSFDHPLPSGGVHSLRAFALASSGARVGTWSVESTRDGGTEGRGGPLAAPLAGGGAAAEGMVATGASGRFQAQAAAEAFPDTILVASSYAWDPSALGLAVEDAFLSWGGGPLVLHTPAGCVRADAPSAPSRAACRILR